MKTKPIILLMFMLYIAVISSCYKNEEYILNDGLKVSDIITIASVNPGSALADSNSQVLIRVTINPNLDSGYNVVLASSAGSFKGGTDSMMKQANLSRYADFILQTGQTPGVVSLHAYVVGPAGIYRADTLMTFSKSYPHSVILQHPSAMAQNTTQEISISLLCKKGYPSKNQVFLFQAVDKIGNATGSFTSTDSFVPGRSLKAQFTPQPNYTGIAKLSVYIVHEDGTQTLGKSEILIQ